jgi:hypothetical protein
MEVMVTFMLRPLYPGGKSPQCPLDRRIGLHAVRRPGFARPVLLQHFLSYDLIQEVEI